MVRSNHTMIIRSSSYLITLPLLLPYPTDKIHNTKTHEIEPLNHTALLHHASLHDFIIPDQEFFAFGSFFVIHRIGPADLAGFKIFKVLTDQQMENPVFCFWFVVSGSQESIFD